MDSSISKGSPTLGKYPPNSGFQDMIDKNRTYKTRDGREVRIYATDGRGHLCVHGAILDIDGKWVLWSWDSEGRSQFTKYDENLRRYELIEVKPRIKLTKWVNVYEDGSVLVFSTKPHADAAGYPSLRIACVKIEIDVEHGHGLGGDE